MAEPAPIDKLTTAQVAALLGVTQSRVHALMRAGRLPSVRVGPLHLIDPADAEKVKVRKPGRPWPAKKKQPAAKPRSNGAVPGGDERQDAAMRKTLKKAGVPMPAKRRKRK